MVLFSFENLIGARWLMAEKWWHKKVENHLYKERRELLSLKIRKKKPKKKKKKEIEKKIYIKGYL